jgi:hypothetical protein
MKSAIELAMERADAALGDESIELSDAQKAAIDEIRKTYQAKWAEQEIALKAKLAGVAGMEDQEQVAEARNQVQREMSRIREQLDAERDAKIGAARNASQG